MGLGRGVVLVVVGNSLEFYNGYVRVVFLVWWDDDKDGYYMFELGENIMLCCNYIFNFGCSVCLYGLVFVIFCLFLFYVVIGGVDFWEILDGFVRKVGWF